MKRDPGKNLCFRCEHRARFLEGGSRPRWECGDISGASCSCYMFKPCRPVATIPSSKKDPRPRFGPAIISSRERADGLAEGVELKAIDLGKGRVALVWDQPMANPEDVCRQ